MVSHEEWRDSRHGETKTYRVSLFLENLSQSRILLKKIVVDEGGDALFLDVLRHVEDACVCRALGRKFGAARRGLPHYYNTRVKRNRHEHEARAKDELPSTPPRPRDDSCACRRIFKARVLWVCSFLVRTRPSVTENVGFRAFKFSCPCACLCFE